MEWRCLIVDNRPTVQSMERWTLNGDDDDDDFDD